MTTKNRNEAEARVFDCLLSASEDLSFDDPETTPEESVLLKAALAEAQRVLTTYKNTALARAKAQSRD